MKSTVLFVGALSSRALLVSWIAFGGLAAASQAEVDIKGANPPGSSGARTAVGPDGFGYTAADETEPAGTGFDYIDISATGTPAGLTGDDAGTGALPIGFSFPFYGVEYTTVAMSTNGYLNFDPDGDLVDFGNDCPGLAAFEPDQSIFVYWDDLVAGAESGHYQTFASCPHAGGGFGPCTIFQWSDVQLFGISTPFGFQAILYRNGNILMQYPAGNTQTGDGSTTGIENQAPSTTGLDYACNTPGSIPAERAILFCAPGNECPAPQPAATEVSTLSRVGAAAFLSALALAAIFRMRG